MDPKEITDLVSKFDFGLQHLSSLFGYNESLEFFVGDSISSEGFVRIEAKKGKKVIYEESIGIPTDYRLAGQFIGELLYHLINPNNFSYVKKREKAFIQGIMKVGRKVNDDCVEKRVMNVIVLACGKIVREAANEPFNFGRREYNKGYFQRNYETMEKIYTIRGKKMIRDLAKLNGNEARMKIIEICEIDIFPGEEQ